MTLTDSASSVPLSDGDSLVRERRCEVVADNDGKPYCPISGKACGQKGNLVLIGGVAKCDTYNLAKAYGFLPEQASGSE